MTKFSSLKRRTLSAAAAAAMLLGGVCVVGNAFAISADASATVVQAISVAQIRALNFGKFLAANGATVTLTAVDATVVGGTATRVNPSTAASGKLTVTGDGQATYTLSGATGTTLTGTDSTTMAVTLAYSSSGTLGGTTGSAGTQDVFVGGTVTQAATNGPGLYQGTYSVTVAYN